MFPSLGRSAVLRRFFRRQMIQERLMLMRSLRNVFLIQTEALFSLWAIYLRSIIRELSDLISAGWNSV